MKKTRDEIQKEAVDVLLANNRSTIHILTGGGKSKVLIDYLMKAAKPYESVLITVPLTGLIHNWAAEFRKWTSCSGSDEALVVVVPGGYITVAITTIQSVYKTMQRVDYLVLDEVHTQVTEEYSQVFENTKHTHCIGLTATPDTLRRTDKQEIYDKYCPILFEYLEGEADGIVNQTKFVIVNHNLDDVFKVKVGNAKKSWLVGEKTQFDYLNQQVRKAQILMGNLGSSDYFSDASEWFWKKRGNSEQMESSRRYLNAITGRRRFLLSLSSSSEIAKRLAKKLIKENDTNKVLVFSELVDQLKKICLYNVYGEQTPKGRNEELIQSFNEGSIRALGSVNSLGMGMNLIGANNAIFESFNSSNTKAQQKVGRMHRLDTSDTATIYFINILNTQVERWLEGMLPDHDLKSLEVIQSSEILA